jgi:hypothetical protein
MLPLLLAISFLGPADQCNTNLSGRYVIQGEDGRVYVSISQAGCTKVSITWESSLFPNRPPAEHHLALDGEFHDDYFWFQGRRRGEQSAASLKDSALEIRMRRAGDGLRLVLLPDGDLCVNGELRASREGTGNRSDEDGAANRSGRGCSAK